MTANGFSFLKNPSAEDQLLFTCTRQHFRESHRRDLATIYAKQVIRWEALYKTAVHHGVAPLVYRNLQQCPELVARLPYTIRDRFIQCTRNNVLVKSLQAERVRGILQFFARRSVPVLLLKGTALDVTVYQQPWYTLSADIDLTIKCHQSEWPAEDRESVHALVRGRNRFERRTTVEFEWFGHHDVSMNGQVPVDFTEVWDRARPIRVDDQLAHVMCPEHMLLAACMNSCRKRFFRLKALCDISEVTSAHTIDWEYFARAACQWRCDIIAYTALGIAAITVGCSPPKSLPDQLRISPFRRRVIEFVGQRQSFSTLATLHRRLGSGLLLPLAVQCFPRVGSRLLRRGPAMVRSAR